MKDFREKNLTYLIVKQIDPTWIFRHFRILKEMKGEMEIKSRHFVQMK